MALTWIGYALLSASVAGSPPADPDVQRQYQEQRAQAGLTPDDQVKLALWCEAHGLPAERLRHLARAVLADPAHATARGLMGLVEYRGKWQAPEAVADRIAADRERAQLLADYEARRSTAAESADGQWRLATWCEEQGLADQARAHFTAVTRLDPGRDAAWKKLGYARVDGRWVTPAQNEANRARAEAQKQADRRWKPLLEKWRNQLATPARRAEAEAALAAVSDPGAVPAIVQVFAARRPSDQMVATRLLAQVDAPAASRALAVLAIRSGDPEVRRAATETLRRRDPREYVGLWIAQILDPIKYQVKPVGGPGSPGELSIEGAKGNHHRVYAPPPVPEITPGPGEYLSRDANGQVVLNRVVPGPSIPFFTNPASPQPTVVQLAPRQKLLLGDLSRLGVSEKDAAATIDAFSDVDQVDFYGNVSMRTYAGGYTASQLRGIARSLPGQGNRFVLETTNMIQVPVEQIHNEAQRTAAAAQDQLTADVAALDQANASVRRANGPVLDALRATTGQSLGDDAPAWGRWWADQEGMAFQAAPSPTQVPTTYEQVPIAYQPLEPTLNVVAGPATLIRSHSCFAAGTPVRTLQGSRPIESLSVGDSVLVQDAATGMLKYRPIVAVYHNQPNATLRVTLDGGDSVVATGIHRFWKAGQGWAMARDLKEGDRVRTLGGVATVRSVAADKVQPVFNLEVAEGSSYFVGSAGALVHDNSLVEPTVRPFDAPAVASRAD